MMVKQGRQCCLNIMLMLLLYFTITAAQNIKLYSYNQSDSVTSCLTGLRKEIDRFVFKSDVDFQNASTDWSRIIEFQYQPPSSTDFIVFCLVDLRSVCSGFDGTKCYCNHTDTMGVHHIVINATAQTEFSNSLLRGYLSYKFSPTIFSSSQIIPTIYDTAASSGRLIVNDIDLQNGLCVLKLRPSDKNIKFCCTNVPTPCVTRILLNGLQLASGTECAEYTATEVTENVNVTFTFSHSVCGVDDPTEYKCTVVLECTTECGWKGILLITIYAIVSATSIILGIVLLICIINKRSNTNVVVCTIVLILIINIIIIIIQATVDPCSCDPDNSTITVSIWKIFLIIYVVILFVIASTVVLVLLYKRNNQ